MKKTILLIIGLCSLSLLHAQIPAAFTEQMEKVMDSICTKKNIKGASAAVLVPGVGIWKGTYGYSYASNPVRTDMLFGIGSNTKTYVSTIMLRLQEMDSLDLDDSIGTWIHDQPNISGQITIRQMLNHTSGLFNYTNNTAFYQRINSNPSAIYALTDMLEFVKEPVFAVGTSWGYSNTNYLLAGIIIEKVMNKPFNVVLKDLITGPQSLDQTIYFPFDNTELEIAHNWSMGVGEDYLVDLYTIPIWSNNAMFSGASTAGAIMATAEDNVKFWDRLMTGQIISKASLAEMKQLVNIGGGFGYGLGVFYYPKSEINNRPVYSHGGTNTGFINENIRDTVSGVCVSVLTNQDSISNDGLTYSIIKALHKVTLQIPITGVKESVYNNDAFRLYPNPASGMLYIDTKGSAVANGITITDLTGRTVLHETIASATDISALPAGLYVVEITNRSGAVVHLQKLQVTK